MPPRRGPMANAPKLKKGEMSKNLKRLIKDFKPYYPQVIVSFICVTISVVLSIVAPQYLSDLSNVIVAGAGSQSIDLNEIQRLAIILVVFYVSNALLSYISGLIMTIVTQKYSKHLRQEISLKINRMPLRYFDRKPYGDTLSIVTNDVDQIGQTLQQSVTMVIQSVFQLIGVLIAMFLTNYVMAFTVLASVPLILIMLLVTMKFAMPLFSKRQKVLGEVNGIVEENITGQIIIKSYNGENIKGKQFDEANENLHQTMFKAQFFGGIMQPMTSFLSYFAYAAVCLVGGLLLVNTDTITFGTITAFLVYVNLFQSPLSQVSQAMNTLQMAAASSGRVFDLLDEEEISDESDKKDLLDINNIQGHVEFKNVKFGYTDKVIIKDFSADIKPGSKVAIVGPTGAGKTTIVNLLMRFYEVNSGDILIDGVSIKDMSRREIRNIFGMVLQDTWMFEGTLRENIVYSRKEISEERLKEIVHDASLTHYVETLPNGLDTVIKEDSSMSAGQKQLITIARAMVENAPLLILDEATSNIDTRTEIQVQEAMDKLVEGRTSFVIAHRLSTIKNADLILVLKDGNIIEQGNHEELLAKKGFYYDLYNSQFESND